MTFRDRLIHGWNAFTGRDPTVKYDHVYSTYRPERRTYSSQTYRTKLASIQNRIALDAASYEIVHCYVNEDNQYQSKIHSGLQNCLELDANIDQTGRVFRHDIFLSMLDEGVVAVVPTDTEIDPTETSSIKIEKMRTGEITNWYTDTVGVNLYNEASGRKENIELPKRMVAIVENPFASVMNQPNSTLQRLKRKLAQMDTVDELSSSGKLDMIIQLPYSLKSSARKQQAEQRRADIEMQLKDSTYGIAYIDATEKVTQINRSLENNLLSQVEKLEKNMFDELYMTPEILNGTADDGVMTNYYSRIIEPIVANFVDEMKRKFLTKTARTQGQSILYYRDPFKLVPVTQIPDLADKLTRNEICSSNEMRSAIGLKPSSDPAADELRNKNLNATEGVDVATTQDELPDDSTNGAIDDNVPMNYDDGTNGYIDDNVPI